MGRHPNPAEEFVSALAQKTFLRFWSFPNVHRLHSGKAKEICDLLVVYDQSLFIFSVKHAQFSFDVPLDVAWRRWFQRAIESSARQLFGAEKFLDRDPRGVFLDNTCTTQLPVVLPTGPCRRVYRILVALGIGAACQRALGSRSGSLILCPSIHGAEHYQYHFQVGTVFSDKPFVHIFDDVTFQLTVSELDTITDFSEYLDARQRLLSGGRIARCDGEENLLATYLHNRASNGDKFGLPKTKRLIHLVDGGWKRVSSNPQFVARKMADRQSYLWDHLIDILWLQELPYRGSRGDLRSRNHSR